MNKFNSPAQGGYNQQDLFQKIEPGSYGNDERPIVARGSYQITENERGEVVDQADGYRFIDDLAEVQEAEEDSRLQARVVEGMQGFLMKGSDPGEESKDTIGDFGATDALRTAEKKDALRGAMGPSVFNYYYDFLYQHRINPLTDEARMRGQLAEMIGSNKELKNLIFDLEQIVFREI